MEAVTFVVVLTAMAFLVESTTEYLFGLWLKSDIIRYVALAVGVVAAMVFELDALQAFFNLQAIVPHAGHVATGLIIGRGANYVHDLVKTYIEPAR